MIGGCSGGAGIPHYVIAPEVTATFDINIGAGSAADSAVNDYITNACSLIYRSGKTLDEVNRC